MEKDLVNSKGATPLYNATISNKLSIASTLIELGCDPNIAVCIRRYCF